MSKEVVGSSTVGLREEHPRSIPWRRDALEWPAGFILVLLPT